VLGPECLDLAKLFSGMYELMRSIEECVISITRTYKSNRILHFALATSLARLFDLFTRNSSCFLLTSGTCSQWLSACWLKVSKAMVPKFPFQNR
jgi:hypothetical protein